MPDNRSIAHFGDADQIVVEHGVLQGDGIRKLTLRLLESSDVVTDILDFEQISRGIEVSAHQELGPSRAAIGSQHTVLDPYRRVLRGQRVQFAADFDQTALPHSGKPDIADEFGTAFLEVGAEYLVDVNQAAVGRASAYFDGRT